MEGFLQSLKFQDLEKQAEICKLSCIKAKKSGRARNSAWQEKQRLWWRGKEIDRHGQEYQDLLDRAYNLLFEDDGFREALLETEDENLTHSIGEKDPHKTVLTEEEFISRILSLRIRARKQLLLS